MTLLVALDVAYTEVDGVDNGHCGIVGFDAWNASDPVIELTTMTSGVAEYVSGRFVERELPCLLTALDELAAALPEREISCIVVDGNVRLDSAGSPGLGLHLFRHLGETVPVIGVAKSAFKDLNACEVNRGTSSKPLYVTAAGIDEDTAAQLVASMHGEHRMPTLLSRADQLSKATSR